MISRSVLGPRSESWVDLDKVEEEYSGGDGTDRKVDDARGRLHQMLLSSLQMEHVMVLAGSGCSLGVTGKNELAAPGMKDLWAAVISGVDGSNASVSKVIPQDPVMKERSSLGHESKQPNIGDRAKLVAKRINYDLNKPDNQNVEAFLSQIETWLLLEVGQSGKVREFLKRSKSVILHKCSGFVEGAELAAHQTFLHRLSRRRTRDQRLKVFTTNYDLCFERAAAKLGCVPVDGFSFSFPRHYNPRFYDYDIVRRPSSGEGQGSYLEGVFQLYKLHGSVNWERQRDGAIVERSDPDPERACLIYPARDKYQNSYAMPYLESISRYLAAVRQPNTCVVVIGFGFNDDHLSQPLLTAVQSNPHLRVIIVDPGIRAKAESQSKALPHGKNRKEPQNETGSEKQEAGPGNDRPSAATPPNHFQQKFLEESGKGSDVWFVNATFDGFADLIPDLKALTPAERLAQAVQDLQVGGKPS